STEYSQGLHSEIPDGSIITIQNEGIKTRIKLYGTFGKPSAYAVASAFLVGLQFKLTANEIGRALEHYSAPSGRMKLIGGIKGSLILDDTYNSSPVALHEALVTLHELPAKRKIAVLGDMLELGKFSEEAHRVAGNEVAKIADMLITVGSHARFIADEALSGGIKNAKVLPREVVHTFRTSDEAGKFLDPIIREGDLILVKGSQGIRMERVVEEIMAEPEKATELLVRQSAYWKNKKSC
ncbi:MAG: cyanophycin synthetase, partial [Patescibacteria group bacterium]